MPPSTAQPCSGPDPAVTVPPLQCLRYKRLDSVTSSGLLQIPNALLCVRRASGHIRSAGPDTPRPGPPAQSLLPTHAVGLEPLEVKKAHRKGAGIGVKCARFGIQRNSHAGHIGFRPCERCETSRENIPSMLIFLPKGSAGRSPGPLSRVSHFPCHRAQSMADGTVVFLGSLSL